MSSAFWIFNYFRASPLKYLITRHFWVGVVSCVFLSLFPSLFFPPSLSDYKPIPSWRMGEEIIHLWALCIFGNLIFVTLTLTRWCCTGGRGRKAGWFSLWCHTYFLSVVLCVSLVCGLDEKHFVCVQRQVYIFAESVGKIIVSFFDQWWNNVQ